MTKKTAKKRGRPPVEKPTDEQLRPSVLSLCQQELLACCLRAMGPWTERDVPAALRELRGHIEAISRRPLLRAWQEQDSLMAAYRQLLAALDACAEVRGLVDSDAFPKATAFLRRIAPNHEGIESPYRLHFELMRSPLDALLAQREKMREVLAAERHSKYTPDSGRRYLLELSCSPPNGRHLDILNIGRPLDVRELAMVSLLVGHWPTVKAGHVTPEAVIHAEVVRLRLAAKERKIPVIEPPPGRGDLCGRVDFGSCHFFMSMARGTAGE